MKVKIPQRGTVDNMPVSFPAKVFCFMQERDPVTHQLINGESIQKRCDLADKYNLRGIACWRIGFESDEAKAVLTKWLT